MITDTYHLPFTLTSGGDSSPNLLRHWWKGETSRGRGSVPLRPSHSPPPPHPHTHTRFYSVIYDVRTLVAHVRILTIDTFLPELSRTMRTMKKDLDDGPVVLNNDPIVPPL